MTEATDRLLTYYNTGDWDLQGNPGGFADNGHRANFIQFLRDIASAWETGSWSPEDLGANLVAWYRADVGVYSDAGTTPATDGQTVQQWNDQSGNNYHLAQATAGNRPIFRSTGLNGKQTVEFVAASSLRLVSTANAVALNTATLSVFAMARMDSATGSYGRLISFIAQGQADDYTNTPSGCLLLRSGTNNDIYAHRNNSVLSIKSIVAGTIYRFGSIFDSANHTVYVDNVAGTPVASTGSFGATGTLSVGEGSGVYWDGLCSEVVIAKTALDADTRLQLHDYLARWT